MKTMSAAVIYMSEYEAIFQRQEYSFSEARNFPDKRYHGTDCISVAAI